MANNYVEWKIAKAHYDNLNQLDLSSEGLKTLPESVGELKELQSLDLSLNDLKTLPEWFSQFTQLKSLDLSGNELMALPEWLSQFKQMQSLALSSSGLTTLPEWMSQLTQLQSLHLSGNNITALPEWLAGFNNLKLLDISYSGLATLPEWMSQLTQLQSLHLSGNNITTLPEWLGQLSQLQSLNIFNNNIKFLPGSLGRLTRLQSLNLSGNKLMLLPEWLGQLMQLKSLDLSDNGLTTLPVSLSQLTQLQSLQLSGNGISTLPESLGQLTQLQTLNLSGNKLKTLPRSLGELRGLQSLNLSNNTLTSLPDSLMNLSQLKFLNLHNNNELGIPPEVLGEERYTVLDVVGIDELGSVDPKKILVWYFQARCGKRKRLNEAKMLLVGQGGVGKTSLAHYLINNKSCSLGEPQTEGINIDDWSVKGGEDPNGESEKIKVHVWDFGGQEIMHATHQFFLTHRSLYLLVIDSRAGEQDSNIHYWLKIIQSYGGESPVIVVVNKCDQYSHELNETSLMRDYANIRGFIQTSCSTGQGIETLRLKIGEHICRLPHVCDMLPQNYFEVKEELETAAAQKNYIPIEEYRAICRRHEVEKSEDQDLLIRFLHDLGVVLNFQDPDDPYGQNDPFVLNPEWVTGGVYAIINDKELKAKRDGLLTCKKLLAVLNSLEGYPRNRHAFIVRKMMQFELAYEIANGKQACWLIPELLDPNEPKDLQWKPETSLNFQYTYPVLPTGIICRFIVRMHQHVDRNNCWRSGSVLTIDGSTVLIRGDIEKRKVFIAVQGAIMQRKEILAIVRDAFRHVHATIPALAPEEEVPLPDNPSVTVPYSHLRKLEECGERRCFPVGADRAYLITELLNGVDSNSYRNERLRRLQKGERVISQKHIFVSYLSDNKDEAERLVGDLENASENVWWNEYILGGSDWKEEIRKAMKNAYAVVLCLSTELAERYRSGVYPEIREAIDTYRQYGSAKSFIFPVRLDDCETPPIEIDSTRTLDRIQHIDLFPESKRRAGLQKLVKSLATAPEHP